MDMDNMAEGPKNLVTGDIKEKVRPFKNSFEGQPRGGFTLTIGSMSSRMVGIVERMSPLEEYQNNMEKRWGYEAGNIYRLNNRIGDADKRVDNKRIEELAHRPNTEITEDIMELKTKILKADKRLDGLQTKHSKMDDAIEGAMIRRGVIQDTPIGIERLEAKVIT